MRQKEISRINPLFCILTYVAFVTGNAKKLEEVKQILAKGNLSVLVKWQALDCISPKLASGPDGADN